jgi:amidase
MRHHFHPTRYYTALGPYEPVLRVASGDTIVADTIDARGVDARGEQVSERGNPQTGPFYVEGAEPGDTLAVTFHRITPSRDSGWNSAVLRPNVVDPADVRAFPEELLADWELDLEANTATLVSPETALGRVTYAFDPMVGCFGVAPSRHQAISSATSAQHGGNMDYRGFRAGVTAYLPVFEPGALFFVGDGHALQADGEILGSGIEVSMVVEFTLRLLKGWPIEWPRGEDVTSVFTVGNARPLDQALQHATSEMLRWLQRDYSLDPRGAHILLGQWVRYEIANVIDPAYSVVCKLDKAVLPPKV